jgi:hypothetical protein
LTYPLDTIRTRLAVSAHGTYSGIHHAVILILRDEGWRGFYRGLAPSMLGILPYAGMLAWCSLNIISCLDRISGMVQP